MNSESNKIAIIGGGPVGIFASYACGILGMKTVLFENRDQLGGQCSALYPEKMIYDIPGIAKITGQQLTDNLIKQANAFKPDIRLNTCITSIKTDKYTDKCIEINNMKFTAVIIASGFGACIPNKLAIDNAVKFENKQIYYNIADISIFAGKKVAILGGGNSAADWALDLSKTAESVSMIHRRDVFTAFPTSVESIKQSKIQLYNSRTIKKLIETNNKLTGILLKSKDTEEELSVDYILACYGMRSDSSMLSGFNVAMNENKISTNNKTCETSKKNIYAVGDIADSDTKTKLFSILSGFNECSLAANHIYNKHFNDNSDKKQNIHSSDLNIML